MAAIATQWATLGIVKRFIAITSFKYFIPYTAGKYNLWDNNHYKPYCPVACIIEPGCDDPHFS